MCRPHCLSHGGCPFHVLDGVKAAGAIPKVTPVSVNLAQPLVADAGKSITSECPQPPEVELPESGGPTHPVAATVLQPRLLSLPSEGVQTPRQPKITTQMNATWMNEFRSTAASVDTGPNASGSRLKATNASNPLVRRFNLVFWDNSLEAANIQIVEECPRWPHWSLDQFSLMHLLGEDLTSIQLFSPAYRVWMTIPLNFVHSLSTNCTVMLRRTGVIGIDEQRIIDLFVPVSPRLFRSNMTSERSYIRNSLKGNKQKARPRFDDGDSDAELQSDLLDSGRKRPRLDQLSYDSTPITPLRLSNSVGPSIPVSSSYLKTFRIVILGIDDTHCQYFFFSEPA